jgi:putative effector of murein hydrolase
VAVALGLGWALGLPLPLLASLAPKGTTAPVAMGVAEALGGVPALAAVFAVLTGLVGAVAGKYLFDALKLKRFEVRGFALGTSAHGIGAARAWQVHPAAGAYAALGLSLQVLIAALLMPLLLPLLLSRLPS